MYILQWKHHIFLQKDQTVKLFFVIRSYKLVNESKSKMEGQKQSTKNYKIFFQWGQMHERIYVIKNMGKFKQIFESEYFIKNTSLPKKTKAPKKVERKRKPTKTNKKKTIWWQRNHVRDIRRMHSFIYLLFGIIHEVQDIWDLFGHWAGLNECEWNKAKAKNKRARERTRLSWASFTKYLFMRKTILTMYGRNFISCFPKYLV